MVATTDRLIVWHTALVMAAASVAAGCSAHRFVMSTGTATCDGKPIADGAISFHPLENNAAPQGSRIVAGRFRIRGKPGRQRVEIVASRPKADGVELTPGMKQLEQFIPSRYNAASMIEIDVTAGGPNVFHFDLESSSPVP